MGLAMKEVVAVPQKGEAGEGNIQRSNNHIEINVLIRKVQHPAEIVLCLPIWGIRKTLM